MIRSQFQFRANSNENGLKYGFIAAAIAMLGSIYMLTLAGLLDPLAALAVASALALLGAVAYMRTNARGDVAGALVVVAMLVGIYSAGGPLIVAAVLLLLGTLMLAATGRLRSVARHLLTSRPARSRGYFGAMMNMRGASRASPLVAATGYAGLQNLKGVRGPGD